MRESHNGNHGGDQDGNTVPEGCVLLHFNDHLLFDFSLETQKKRLDTHSHRGVMEYQASSFRRIVYPAGSVGPAHSMGPRLRKRIILSA